ncbi:MAG TPA: ABC transporter permease [Gemmatimonadales bacterium]|nr:ABC transporter permease [Gemmatimonadales bacterium]
MKQLRALLARIAGLFGGSRSDADLTEELASHLEMATAENVRRGMTPDEAHRQARLAAGGITQAAEAVRDRRGLPAVSNLVSDVRYAVRTLRRSPGFTAVVVLTLALGIGANTAIFSVIRGVLLKPLPYRDGSRLVYLRQASDGPSGANMEFSVPEITDITQGVPGFSGVAQYSPFSLTLQGDKAVTLTVGLVTGNFFDVMGLKPVLGRVTLPSDDGSGVPPVMVLTYNFWMNRFGGDTSIVGRDVTLDGHSVRVIGVLQPAPYFPDPIDALLNMVISPHHVSATMIQGRTHRMTEVFARLTPETTLQQARNEVATTYARMRNDHPDAYDPGSHYRVAVTPLKTAIGERAQLTLWLLMVAAAFVLIIAAANVANLTLMRGVRREHELVTRAALGAGVARLRRLLLAENMVLTLLGGTAGVAVAIVGVRMLTALAARYSPRAAEIRLDATVLGFALALSVVLALLLSFVAVLPPDGALAAWLAAGGRRSSGGVRKQRLQRGLVVAQVAASVVLMAGAGLLTRTILQLSEVSTGLRSESMVTMEMQLMSFTAPDAAALAASEVNAKLKYAQMQQEVRTLPGVIDVGIGSTMPLRNGNLVLDVKAEGQSLAPGAAQPRAEMRTGDPNYFTAAGIPLLAGRNFTATDQRGSGLVVIINKTLADQLFPGQDPIGRHIAWTGEVLKFSPFSGDWRTVVGVAANTHDGAPGEASHGVVFEPFAQEVAIGDGLVIRADQNLTGVTTSALRVVRDIAPGVPVEHVQTLTQYRDENVAPQRLNAELVSAFSLLAVVIAAVGIAGVLAFSVSARTGEIGIRMSLGAEPGQVQRMILGEGGIVLVIGLLIGVVGAFLATGVIRGLLFDIPPHDPVTFVSVTALMALIGLVACWIPALRAARIDPVIAMRAQ